MHFFVLTGGVFTQAAESPVAATLEFQTPITNASIIRSMAPEQAARRLPVRFQGVVTYVFDPRSNPRSCFVQDQFAGIFVGNGVEVPAISAGDVVLVEGVSDPGDYAPLVRPSKLQVVGRTNLPSAHLVSFADLMTGHEDSQFVEIAGLVRAAFSDSQGQQMLEIDMGGGRVTVYVPKLPETDLMRLVDSTVRVRGVCGSWFNKLRQLFGVRLMVPRREDITVEEAAAPDVWEQPAQPIGSLLRFTPQGPYGHQVKVSGTVVMQQPGRALFLQDEQHGLCVQTRQPGALNPGDQVEVVGFPDKGEYTPLVQDATWRRTASGPEPEPVLVRPDEALSGLQDCRLVAIEGNLLDQTHSGQETTLVLGGDGYVFSAHLNPALPTMVLAPLQNQSRLRLTGICRIEVGEDWRAGPEWRAKSFTILLRNPADVQVLTLPPWWSLRRLLWIMAILVAIMLASLLWATSLRSKVRQQTSIISQKLDLEARLKERYHDLFESANDMVYTHDLNGRVTSINMAGEQFLGRNRTSVIGTCLPDFIAEEQRPAARRWLEEISNGAAPATVEWDFLTAAGQRVRLETSTRLVAHNGQDVEVEGIARDVTEQRRLEKEILEVSTREQHRIGHDLHDGVCQQLAGIAVLADVLTDKLGEEARPEACDAQKITELVHQVNRQTRGVARGLFPVRLEENGLVSALHELAENAGIFYKTPCKFLCDAPVVVRDHSFAHHLYFIAHEAILNAVKHGKAGSVEVQLVPDGNLGCVLTVRDNGVGLPGPLTSGPGMGIRIMKYRARMIGATLALRSPTGGGVEVVCHLIHKPKADEPLS
jgi:PAS domain S-box-containing protein